MIPPSAPALILASASPARHRLLVAAGIDHAVDPAFLDEGEIRQAMIHEGASALDAAQALAEMKARRMSTRYPGSLILAADQILECEGIWFEKPASMAEARRHLEHLSGRVHHLATVACLMRDGRTTWHVRKRPLLQMRPLGPAFLDWYLEKAGSAVLDSVGAYQLEGLGVQLFVRIEGDSFTIQGLPLLELLENLREHGVVER